MIPTREEAWTILKKYNDSEALLRHALTVEGCMRHFAELAGEDPELWGAVGLLHDVDVAHNKNEHEHDEHDDADVVENGCDRHITVPPFLF